MLMDIQYSCFWMQVKQFLLSRVTFCSRFVNTIPKSWRCSDYRLHLQCWHWPLTCTSKNWVAKHVFSEFEEFLYFKSTDEESRSLWINILVFMNKTFFSLWTKYLSIWMMKRLSCEVRDITVRVFTPERNVPLCLFSNAAHNHLHVILTTCLIERQSLWGSLSSGWY